ncbi:MAG: cation-translocating P-type ATPase [Gammaproteobacteria bacterium]|nr:cation-translocating P-type ATPase [Gammaproteobacteria bacterium]
MQASTQKPPDYWHTKKIDEVFRRFDTSATGLSNTVAKRRLAEHGPNVIPDKSRRSLFRLFLGQFSDFMMLVLLGAALISGIVGEPQDTIAILVIVMLNAIVGAVQEFRADRALAALRTMTISGAQVLRDGRVVSLAASQLVPGDVVLLDAGEVVPADLRLLETEELQADESALTGESQPVDKQPACVTEVDLPLGERKNLAFKSTLVTRGRGQGIVVATGLETEIGCIAELLRSGVEVKTPLQVRLARFGRRISVAILAICLVVFVAGLLQGQPVMLMLLTAVSLAVAAIPEALPAVITVSLALGARKLVRFKALARNLPALETLGSVTYICTDKTGTLTRNRMAVELYFAAGERRGKLPQSGSGAAWEELGRAIALNNDVTQANGQPVGEPTELALFEGAADAGLDRAQLEQEWPRVAAIPFDSERRLMTTLHQAAHGVIAYIKGAPEQVLAHCDSAVELAGQTSSFKAEAILTDAAQLANEGYRVLALAKRNLPSVPVPLKAAAIERDLTFIGLVALIDPLRSAVPQAMADCLKAGITPVMITGDHPGTAKAIAGRLGLSNTDESLLTGSELEQLSDEGLAAVAKSIRIYARVNPAQKLRIVKALQASGEFVAMTGDGVNDAPALKRAEIGVAMGRTGTDVAREAADIVLLDDNFATIVKAIQAGRRIFDNIRKFIKDTMSSNSGEIWTLFLAPFLGLPIPLLPIHILWINLLTDGLPGLAFAAEPAEPDIMDHAPRPPDESIFAHGMWQHILWMGLFVGGLSIAALAWAVVRGVEYWQTVVFTVLAVSQLFHSLAVRSETASLFRIGLFSNLPMLGAVLLALSLQMALIYVPALNTVFHTQPLPMFDLAICLALSSLVLVAVEIEKTLVRRGLLYRVMGEGSAG